MPEVAAVSGGFGGSCCHSVATPRASSGRIGRRASPLVGRAGNAARLALWEDDARVGRERCGSAFTRGNGGSAAGARHSVERRLHVLAPEVVCVRGGEGGDLLEAARGKVVR